MIRLRSLKVAFLALGILLPAASSTASAATVQTSFTVTATVLKACFISATNISFGIYNPVSPTALTANGTLSVTCTNTTGYTTGLSAGTSSGATVTNRKMTGQTTSNTLSYGLYQDASHATNWGNTVGTDTPSAITGTGSIQTATIYGQINSGTPGNIDIYSDTITMTVTY
jgi:spore coat protein U-like protein